MARSIDTQQSAVRGFVPAQNDEERFLMRHVEDLARAAFGRGIARYSAFLSDREQQLRHSTVPVRRRKVAASRAAGPTPSAGCSALSRKTVTLQALSAASGSGAVRWPGRSCPSIRIIWAV